MSKNSPAAGAAAAAADKPGMTAAEAAKKVKRPTDFKPTKVGEDKDGNPVMDLRPTKFLPVAASEVLDFRDYGSHVVVVTTDGQKFSSADAA
jgi:hypothetical protein